MPEQYNEYKQIECIAKMPPHYQTRFDNIVAEYAPKLLERLVVGDAAYTAHDFKHHCIGIYKIISKVLFDEQLIYQKDYGLNEKELFILNLAVLFHDIGMSNMLGANRTNHSVASAQYVQKIYDKKHSVFRRQADLTINEVKALKAIIIAHSNVKDGTVREEENGMYSPTLRNYESMTGEIIRAKFLAGILRLADELDVSSERLGTAELEEEIEEGVVFEAKEWEGYKKSLEYWEKLHYIENISRSVDKTTIRLIIDDEYVEKCLDAGDTEKSIARDLKDIFQKIEKELKEITKVAFNEKREKNCIPVTKIIMETQNSILQAQIDKELSITNLPKKEENHLETTTLQEAMGVLAPTVIDGVLEQQLYQEVNERKLLKFGHFLLDDNYCARDWIDTKEVVETKKILNDLVETMVRHINSNNQDDYMIVGVDLVGAMLGARVAFALQKPLSYVVSSRDKNNNANPDIELETSRYDKIILVTDAIVTYESIIKLIEEYNLSDKVEAIYTIFYRPSEHAESVDSSYISKTYSINNMFKIEMFDKSKCIYKKKECIAQNRRIYC